MDITKEEHPGHWAHLDENDERPGTVLNASCDGEVYATICFGEPTAERHRRWFQRVMLEHQAHCTLQPKEHT
jgi:hypothetical protein